MGRGTTARRVVLGLVAAVFAVVLAGAGVARADVPVLDIDNPHQPEGTGSNTTMTFTISIPAATDHTVTVDYGTVNLTATSPSDYAPGGPVVGTATIDQGQTQTTVDVPIVGDNNYEDNENFKLQLSNPQGATFPGAQLFGIGTITDDDAPPVFSIADQTVQGSAEGTGTNRLVVFDVSLSAAAGKTLTVDAATMAGTGVTGAIGAMTLCPTGADYQDKMQTMTFNPGTTKLQFSVVVCGDSVDELDENFTVTLSNPQSLIGNTASPPNPTIDPLHTTATGSIPDDDGPAVNISNTTVLEGPAGTPATANLAVALSAPSVQDVTVTYTTSDATATAGSDYVAAPANATLTIPAGQVTGMIPITVTGDNLFEDTETFKVTLSSPVDGTIQNGVGVVTITDDDIAPTIIQTSATLTEGSGTLSTATVTVSLTAPSGKAVTTNYSTADNTATAPGDYQTTTGTLTFNPGETSKTVQIPIVPDFEIEEDETFFLNVTDPVTGSNIAIPVTIVDDDLTAANTPNMTVSDASVREGDSGSRFATFTVKLDGPLARTITVEYATSTVDGTATAGADFIPVSGALTFLPGETTHTVVVEVLGDTKFEFNEDYRLVLSNVHNARLSRAAGLGVIIDDDAGGGPVSLGSTKMPASSILCRRGHRCGGLLVRWTIAVRGTMRVTITAPTAQKSGAAQKSAKAKILQLVDRSYAVKPGAGSAHVKLGAGRTATRLLRAVRAAKIKAAEVTVTFTNFSGGQQVKKFTLLLT